MTKRCSWGDQDEMVGKRMKNMMQVLITYEKGIHTRIAAMIVKRCQELMDQYGCQLFISRPQDQRILPGNSMLALVSMRIRKGELINVFSDDPGSEGAVRAFGEFLSGSFVIGDGEMDEVDHILQANTLASEKVFESIANGIMVLDSSHNITVFNQAAEKITGIPATEAIGRRADEVFQNLQLQEVLKSGQRLLAVKQTIGKNTVITNYTPVYSDGQIMGAVAVFQDISELEALSGELRSVKELKEQFKYILEGVDDGICMIDPHYQITYVNQPFKRLMATKEKELIGQSALDILPKEILLKVLNRQKPIQGEMMMGEDGAEVMLNISPVSIDGELLGAMVVAKELTEIKRLAEKVEALSAKTVYLQEELVRKEDLNQSFHIITGKSGVLMEALSVASKASGTDATVLIRGESGTGKELVAKAIHYASARRDKPIVRVNCAAIPSNLLESELFGYEKGAFTGAVKQKLGKFELANEGTIFLDEIGDMDISMQTKLLRVLQEREIERIGGIKPIKTNVRIIAATNRPLEQMIASGEFRSDLYYRLNVIPVMLPPLRERKGDIPLLVEHFIEKIGEKYGLKMKGIKRDAMKCLQEYAWPGNVRELENIIERAMTLASGEWITVQDLPSYIAQVKGSKESSNPSLALLEGDALPKLEEVERLLIQRALEIHKTFRAAGKALGLNHKTIAAKARKYNLVEH